MRTLTVLLYCISLCACSRTTGGDTLVVHLPPDLTPIERSFAAALAQAFEQKDAVQLSRLTHWKAPEDARLFSDFYIAVIARGCRSITIIRADPELASKRIENNVKARASLPVRWTVTLEHPAKYPSYTDLNAGLDNGTIKLTTYYVVNDEANRAAGSD